MMVNLDVKILGPGCPKCKILKRHTQKAVEMLAETAPEIAVNLQVVADIDEIIRYDILSTPALVINERLVAVGKVLRTHEILEWLKTVARESPVN